MKINRIVIDQTPNIFNNQHFSLTPDAGTNFTGTVYPFPPPAIASQVWTAFDELFDIGAGTDEDWYVGPLGPYGGFGVPAIKNQDGFILAAQCCESGVWILSNVSIVRFLLSPWTSANSYLIGYSDTNPPS